MDGNGMLSFFSRRKNDKSSCSCLDIRQTSACLLFYQDGQQVNFGIELTSTKIKVNGTPVSLEGHTHTSSDLETVLYSSDTGTTSTVTLSESAENFTYLEIYYNYNSSNKATSPQFSTKVFSPNSKYVALEGMFRANSQTMQFLQETVQISGKQILRTNSNGWWQNSNTSTSTVTTGSQKSLQFYIQRVVGIK